MNAKELSIGFTRDRFCEHGFASARRSNQQDTFGKIAAEAFVFLRVQQEIDDLLHLAFGLFNTGDIAQLDSGSLPDTDCFFRGPDWPGT